MGRLWAFFSFVGIESKGLLKLKGRLVVGDCHSSRANLGLYSVCFGTICCRHEIGVEYLEAASQSVKCVPVECISFLTTLIEMQYTLGV
jgi:hypothetical protein